MTWGQIVVVSAMYGEIVDNFCDFLIHGMGMDCGGICHFRLICLMISVILWFMVWGQIVVVSAMYGEIVGDFCDFMVHGMGLDCSGIFNVW